MSELALKAGGKTSSSSTFSSSSSSTFSTSSSSGSSSKVVKSTSSTSSKTVSQTSSKTSSVSIKSSAKSYSDKLAIDMGLDASKEMERLKLRMNEEMSNIHRDMFRLMPSTPPPPTGSAPPALEQAPGGSEGVCPAALNAALVRLDAESLRSCVDDDRMKLNFDVSEYESESVSVKTCGNKIEVHAVKKSKKGDEERNEEFSRVYQLPTSHDVDPSHVTSSMYQDGVLTIELPVAEALDATAA